MVRQSGCQICALTGQCNAAFHNQPGQYCGSYYDILEEKPCCCPFEQNGNLVTCNVSPTQCKCHVSTDNYQPSSYSNYNYHSSRLSREYQTSIWVPLIVIFLCICCCCRSRRHGHQQTTTTSGYNGIPVATAIPTASCPPAENPDYHPTTNYGSTMYRNEHHQSGGGGGGGSAVASGLGGLAVGTILGNLMGRNNAHRNHHHHHNVQRGFGGGGYDIAGASGDSGGYDIAGDS